MSTKADNWVTKLVAWCAETYWHLKEQAALDEIRSYYRKAGHPDPLSAAFEELERRALAEDCREWANRRFASGRCKQPDQLKAQWIERNGAAIKNAQGGETAKVVCRAIADMPAHELLTASHFDEWVERCRVPELDEKTPTGMPMRYRRILAAG